MKASFKFILLRFHLNQWSTNNLNHFFFLFVCHSIQYTMFISLWARMFPSARSLHVQCSLISEEALSGDCWQQCNFSISFLSNASLPWKKKKTRVTLWLFEIVFRFERMEKICIKVWKRQKEKAQTDKKKRERNTDLSSSVGEVWPSNKLIASHRQSLLKAWTLLTCVGEGIYKLNSAF